MKYKFDVIVVNTPTQEYSFNAKGLTIDKTIESISQFYSDWTSAVIVITPETDQD